MKINPINHLAIIMDGNRRWAKGRGLPAMMGHKEGAAVVKTIARNVFLQKKIKVLTLYTLSSENLINRPQKELHFIFRLLINGLTKQLDEFCQKGVRLKVIGRRQGLPKLVIKTIEQAQAKTKNGRRGLLQLAINYNGRDEIVDAVKKIIASGKQIEAVDQKLISQNLYNPGVLDPDLIIRTSGEQRLSGFLTWQNVYSEFYFSRLHWPAFTLKELDKALTDYSKRQRRFGGQ